MQLTIMGRDDAESIVHGSGDASSERRATDRSMSAEP